MEKVYFIEGKRTPFLKSGTDYRDLLAYELGKIAISALIKAVNLNGKHVDEVAMGNVIANIKTPNLAREAALSAGIPFSTPCYTVSQACISANRAIANISSNIQAGHIQVGIAGGADSASDVPILFRKEMQKKLFAAQKLNGIGDYLKFISSLSYKDFIPQQPTVAEYLTQRTMGQDCELLAAQYEISRIDQDKYAALSHQNAFIGQQNGFLKQEVETVSFPPKFINIQHDNGIRGETSTEKLKNLRPVFDKKFGTLTAGNSSFLTDGAAACLLANETAIARFGLEPKAEIIDWAFSGQSIENELLLGPAYAITQLLHRNKMSIDDIDVIEIHEAFAAQVLANLAAINNESFHTALGLGTKPFAIPFEKLNIYGGSLAIGHPFGATGARLLTTTANRLIANKGKYGLLAACAAGGHGHAMLIKNAK